jgi:hypothetical protein
MKIVEGLDGFWPLVALIATLFLIAGIQIAAVKCLVTVAELAGSDMQFSQPEDRRACKAEPVDDLLLAARYASEIGRPCGD